MLKAKEDMITKKKKIDFKDLKVNSFSLLDYILRE